MSSRRAATDDMSCSVLCCIQEVFVHILECMVIKLSRT